MILRGHTDLDRSIFLYHLQSLLQRLGYLVFRQLLGFKRSGFFQLRTGISVVSLPLTWQARAQNAELEILRQQQERDLAEAGLRTIQMASNCGHSGEGEIENLWILVGFPWVSHFQTKAA